MSSILFLKRIFKSKAYWLSVMAALLLLLCSVVYTDVRSGEQYVFISLAYDDAVIDAFSEGLFSLENILFGYDASYFWMFCPIIVGIPGILTKKTERFVLFRTNKNRYLLSKYFSNLFASGSIVALAYVIFSILILLVAKENIWNLMLLKKIMSVFCWGVFSSIPSMLLVEIVENKYLILCIPFVINYFLYMFCSSIVPYQIWSYISPNNFQILFFQDERIMIFDIAILSALILICAILKKLSLERRCDCGQ